MPARFPKPGDLARIFHQGAGIWRDGLRPELGAADEANSGDYWRGEQAQVGCKAAVKNRAGQPCKSQRQARRRR